MSHMIKTCKLIILNIFSRSFERKWNLPWENGERSVFMHCHFSLKTVTIWSLIYSKGILNRGKRNTDVILKALSDVVDYTDDLSDDSDWCVWVIEATPTSMCICWNVYSITLCFWSEIKELNTYCKHCMLTYAQGIAPARKNMILVPITSFFFLAGASPCGLIMRVMQSTLILKKLKPTFF